MVLVSLPQLVGATDFDIYPAPSKIPTAHGVVLLQGANVDKSQYSKFASQLALSGFHVIVPNVLRKIDGVDQPGLFTSEDVVNESFEKLKTENETLNSILFHKVDIDGFALVGHSLGGMVGLLSVDGRCLPPLCVNGYARAHELKAAVILGASAFWQGREFLIDTHATPLALISGDIDSFATPAAELNTYDRLDSPRVWLAIKDANHYAMTNLNPAPGARPDNHIQPISQTDSIAAAAIWASKFLRIFLLNDKASRAELEAAAKNLPTGLSQAKVSLE